MSLARSASAGKVTPDVSALQTSLQPWTPPRTDTLTRKPFSELPSAQAAASTSRPWPVEDSRTPRCAVLLALLSSPRMLATQKIRGLTRDVANPDGLAIIEVHLRCTVFQRGIGLLAPRTQNPSLKASKPQSPAEAQPKPAQPKPSRSRRIG